MRRPCQKLSAPKDIAKTLQQTTMQHLLQSDDRSQVLQQKLTDTRMIYRNSSIDLHPKTPIARSPISTKAATKKSATRAKPARQKPTPKHPAAPKQPAAPGMPGPKTAPRQPAPAKKPPVAPVPTKKSAAAGKPAVKPAIKKVVRKSAYEQLEEIAQAKHRAAKLAGRRISIEKCRTQALIENPDLYHRIVVASIRVPPLPRPTPTPIDQAVLPWERVQ
jgi:hypothetical protein